MNEYISRDTNGMYTVEIDKPFSLSGFHGEITIELTANGDVSMAEVRDVADEIMNEGLSTTE